jgi:hypothetical protein
MTTKLTLSVEKRVVLKAKRYARTHKKSLSQLVTNYLDHISSQDAGIAEYDPEVLDAAGQIPVNKMSDIKDPKYRYLKDKYLHG